MSVCNCSVRAPVHEISWWSVSMMNAFFGISSLLLTFYLVFLGPYELWDRRACQHSHQKLSGIEFNKQEATYKNIESEKWHTKAEIAFAAKVPICRWVLHGRQRREPRFSGSSWLQHSLKGHLYSHTSLEPLPSPAYYPGLQESCSSSAAFLTAHFAR